MRTEPLPEIRTATEIRAATEIRTEPLTEFRKPTDPYRTVKQIPYRNWFLYRTVNRNPHHNRFVPNC